jgi:hypothetical protein
MVTVVGDQTIEEGGQMRARPSLGLVPLLVLALGLGAAGCSDDDGAGAASPPTTAAAEALGLEPPANPFLAESPWGAAHRGSYAQASSDLPGPEVSGETSAERTVMPGVPVIMQFSSPYDDGGVAVWTTVANTPDRRSVVKVDHATGEIIDTYVPAEEGFVPPATAVPLTGAYNMLDRDDHLIVGYADSVEVYGDERPGELRSPITLLGRYQLPDEALCRPDDAIVGQTMTYDGQVAFVTELGTVGVLPRDPAEMSGDTLRVVSLNGAACDDPAVARDDLEIVSNSIATDESGGIYVVTSQRMVRVNWDPDARELSEAWSAPYETGARLSDVRLAAGSGSTPTVMGTAADDDRFVVITDGQELMHLVLLWRDEIPEGWEPIAAGKDRRIACEVPVRFGDESVERTESEQSVLVRGHAAVVVSNRLANQTEIDDLPDALRLGVAGLSGGDPAVAPHGLERIDWDPTTRTCSTVWANTDVSIPNAIPTMSEPSNLVYGIGQRDGLWGLEGIDFTTGDSTLWVPAPAEAGCAASALAQFVDATSSVFGPYLERLPHSCDNSYFSATEIGPDGTVYTGNFTGLTAYRPAP